MRLTLALLSLGVMLAGLIYAGFVLVKHGTSAATSSMVLACILSGLLRPGD